MLILIGFKAVDNGSENDGVANFTVASHDTSDPVMSLHILLQSLLQKIIEIYRVANNLSSSLRQAIYQLKRYHLDN